MKIKLHLATLAIFATVIAVPTDAHAFWWWFKKKPTPDLVQKLEQDGRFGTLLFALEATGLDDVVRDADALTVFAPTDDAFAALPDGALDALVQDPAALTSVLLYHVLPGKVSASSLFYGTTATTIQGSDVIASWEDHAFLVNRSEVIGANVKASNGLVHVIDAVLLPPAETIVVDSILDLLKLDGRFSTLLFALEASGLDDALDDGGALTLFAPTDDAFAALPPEILAAAVADPEGLLTDVLLYHVVGDDLSAFALFKKKGATTLLGQDVDVSYAWRSLFVNDAEVVNTNLRAGGGFVHTLDAVLIPGG